MISILIFASLSTIGMADTTRIYVDPSTGSANVGDTFSVNINIANANNLAGYEFKLYYDTNLLDPSPTDNFTEGSFLKNTGHFLFQAKDFNDNYNATHGRIWVYAASLGSDGVSGSGTLATIKFKVMSSGKASLILSNTRLGDNRGEIISHTIENGNYEFKQSCTCTAWRASGCCGWWFFSSRRWVRTCTPTGCDKTSKCEGYCWF